MVLQWLCIIQIMYITDNILIVSHTIKKVHHMTLYTGVVSQLLVESRTSTSLTLIWDSPDYYSSNLTGLLQYRAIHDKDINSIYIVESPETLPTITDLEEFTAYSIEMAVFDDTNKLCVFSEEFIAQTGLPIKL